MASPRGVLRIDTVFLPVHDDAVPLQNNLGVRNSPIGISINQRFTNHHERAHAPHSAKKLTANRPAEKVRVRAHRNSGDDQRCPVGNSDHVSPAVTANRSRGRKDQFQANRTSPVPTEITPTAVSVQ